MTNKEKIIAWVKISHSDIVEVPRLINWLVNRGEPESTIESVKRLLRYNKKDKIQFAKKVDDKKYQILSDAPIIKKEESNRGIKVIPGKSWEEFDAEMFPYVFGSFENNKPAYLICNRCGESFSGSFYSAHVKLHIECPKCSHLIR